MREGMHMYALSLYVRSIALHTFRGMRTSHNAYMVDGGKQNDHGCSGRFMNLP